MMDDTAFTRLREIFNRLYDLPPDERRRYLDQVQEIGETTRGNLRGLLEADAALENMTARRAADAAALESDRRSMIGRRIGAFVIERELGRGGMGSVYLAHRADGSVEQKVALKLIRPEQLDEHTLARFRLERQVLALLKHPHIATLLDVGETHDGAPYVVMEYIEGEPITEYCAKRNPDLRARLKLFLDICDAVSYAHRSMVVHRDLKPGNILVTANGRPKLLDFGIAKPLLTRLGTQHVSETDAAQRFFSPSNAAPEQIRGEPITVACDVYGLGVLLYQLLAGVAPFELAGKTPGEIERIILGVEPRAPSERVASHALRGDLDAIALRALRKDARERYTTVDQFADDVRAWLEHRPVAARNRETAYRARKFLARHRIALGIGAAFAVLAVGAGVSQWLQMRETTYQRDRARNANEFLIEAFRAADPSKALGEKITAKDILDQAERSLAVSLNNDPDLRAELLGQIAEVKINLQASKAALDTLRHALQSLSASRRDTRELRVQLLTLQARAAMKAGDFELAKQAIDAASALNPPLERRAVVQASLIDWLFVQGKGPEDLRPPLNRALNELAPNLAPDSAERWDLILTSAKAQQVVDGPAAGVKLVEDLLHENGSDTHDLPQRLAAQRQLAGLYDAAGRYKDSAALLDQMRSLTEQLYGKESLAVASWDNERANAAAGTDDQRRAAELYGEAMAIYQAKLGKSTLLASTQFNAAGAQEDLGEYDDAERNYRGSIAMAPQVYPEGNENIEIFRTAFALFLNTRHRFAEAVPLFERSLARVKTDPAFADDGVHKAARFGLAIARYAEGKKPENRASFIAASSIDDTTDDQTVGMLKKQMAVAKELGLPTPLSGPLAEKPR